MLWLAQKIPGGQSRSFQRVEDNALHLIKVNWTAPTFEEDRCVHAFVRLPRRAPNNSIPMNARNSSATVKQPIGTNHFQFRFHQFGLGVTGCASG